jgi:hypothetical protein
MEDITMVASKAVAEFKPVTKSFSSREEVDAYIAELEAQEEGFVPVTITFDSETELHDILAALGAYHDKKARVCDTNTAPKFGLTAYSGNARATVRRVLPELLESLGIEADTTPLG